MRRFAFFLFVVRHAGVLSRKPVEKLWNLTCVDVRSVVGLARVFELEYDSAIRVYTTIKCDVIVTCLRCKRVMLCSLVFSCHHHHSVHSTHSRCLDRKCAPTPSKHCLLVTARDAPTTWQTFPYKFKNTSCWDCLFM